MSRLEKSTSVPIWRRLPHFVQVWGLAYLVGVLLCALCRLLFYLQHSEKFRLASASDILMAFPVGWRFDQVVILFILLPIMLILPWLSLARRGIQIVVAVYLSILMLVMVLTLLADIRFFKYFGSHLNFQVVQYLSGGRTITHLVFSEPMFYPFLLGALAVGAAVFWLWRRTVRSISRIPQRAGWMARIGWVVLCFALSFLGIRGRLGLSPIDWGVAYFSHNQFANQLALNGVYTLGKAFSEEGKDPRLVYLPESLRFPFVPFSQGMDSVRTWLAGPNETWLDQDSTLRRHVSASGERFSFRPNVVIVLMESWSGRNTGALGNSQGITPEFDSLAAHGILFTNFYANGTRTNYGMPAVLCAFPSLPGRSIMTRYNALHPFVTLSEILHDRGYFNGFAYGGDLAFDNLEGFFRNKKFDRFYGDHDLGIENVFAKWGIPDHIVFHKVVGLLDSIPRPFQMTVLTLSNHEPFDLPDSSTQMFKEESDNAHVLNAHHYADFALGKFIAEFKTRPAFDSTIFVFTADHAKWGAGKIEPDPVDFQVPLLIYSPKLLGATPVRIDRVGGQIDIMPTLLDLFGTAYVHESWGRDLLNVRESDKGFAIVNVLNTIGIISNGYLYGEPVGGEPFLYSLDELKSSVHDLKNERPEEFARLQRRLRIFMQIADQSSTPQAK
ncbi:MAG: LTA synthase family protein [Candidatus Zixiibacteriota bacterium]